MREDFVQFMANQVEAQKHKESKFWRASKPLPNQSSVQGRKSKKESKRPTISHSFAKFLQACEIAQEELKL